MTADPGDFAGQVVLVTGGSRGIGRATAAAFASRAATVVIASRKPADGEATAAELAAQFGSNVVAFTSNVSDWAQCDALVDRVIGEFGQVDVLVNNAGSSLPYESIDEVSEALFDKVIAINLRGPFRLMVRCGQAMMAGNGGAIVNVSSLDAVRTRPNALPYGAAKAGLNALTRGFAHAFGPGVRVNAVQPGPVRTDIAASWIDGVRQRYVAASPLARIGEPGDIANAVVFLASSASAFTTGAVLEVDGAVTDVGPAGPAPA